MLSTYLPQGLHPCPTERVREGGFGTLRTEVVSGHDGRQPFADHYYPKWSSAPSAHYLRITARNLGDLPTWHGSKGQCWLFCDEIVVR